MARSPSVRRPDRHVLYEAAVQSVEHDLDFFERVYRATRGRGFTRLREDFSGTAALSCAWVMRGRLHRAWAVDHDPAVLAWARRHRLPRMREAARRLTLECRDARARSASRVDVVVALNFSYWVFHARRDLLAYLRAARRGLRVGGLFFAHVFGGTEAMEPLRETRRIGERRSVDGSRVAPFTYVWEQTSFNPVDHRLRCSIHFRLQGRRVMRQAFRYDWRMWTLPEQRELLLEAGFARTEVHLEERGPRRGRGPVYRRRERFENHPGWLAYVVGVA